MKKILLVVAFAALSLSASAGDVPKKPSVSGFVSNGFWDNWEISVGGGVGTAIGKSPNLGNFGDRIGFEANFSLTKWLHPVFGGRLQLQGGRLINFDANMGQIKWPYIFVHTDAMINISNWFGGYREDRAYYAVPFFGFGYMASNFTDNMHSDYGTPTNQAFAFTYGILNKFRISQSFDFNIELKGMMTRAQMSPAALSGSFLNGFSATAGFTYRFNQRGWERGVPGFTAADIQAFQDAVVASDLALAAVAEENGALAQALVNAQADAERARQEAAAAKAAAAKAAQTMKSEVPYESLIFYDINASKLTSKDKTRLQLVAEHIKSGPKDQVYTIVGHADHQTGTPAYNMTLSKERAKRVYDYLVSQGVSPDQLSYQGQGGDDNPFNIQKANRSVVVE